MKFFRFEFNCIALIDWLLLMTDALPWLSQLGRTD